MSNRLPAYGDFEIPSEIIDQHEWVSDAFIDDLGKVCTLNYPPIIVECVNCVFNPITGASSNVYKVGGPQEFSSLTICPLCGGTGKKSTFATEDITMRVYLTPKDWINIGVEIKSPDGMAQTIGYITDWPKVLQADTIILNSRVQGIVPMTYEKFGDGQPWGFRLNRYFIQFWKRS